MLARVVLAFVVVVVLILPVASAPKAQGATPAEIEQAITNGLAWLAAQQKGDGHFESTGHTIEQHVAATCFAVAKFEHRGWELYREPHEGPFDDDYQYHQQVEDGLNYVFAHMVSDGNGVHFGGSVDVYTTGICMMAAAASGAPTRTVPVLDSDVDGWTYEAVLQGMLDWMEYAQTDGINPDECNLGGWGYVANDGRSDNSNSGYATLGIGFAGRMGLSPADATLTKLSTFIDNVQTGTGGSIYDPCDGWIGENILKTGNLLYEMKLAKRPLSDPTVQAAKVYIENHWNYLTTVGWQLGPGRGYYQAMFTMMKGLESYGIHMLGGGVGDWFDTVSTYIVGEQKPEGYWEGVGAGSVDWVLETSWALLTLEKVIPVTPCADPPSGMAAWWPLNEGLGADTIDDIWSYHYGTPLPGTVGTTGPVPGAPTNPHGGVNPPSVVDGSLYFDDSAAGPPRVVVPSSTALEPGSGDFSIDAWVYPQRAGAGDSQEILEKWDSLLGRGYEFYIEPEGVLAFVFAGDTSSVVFIAESDPPALPYDQWSHVAVTYSSGGHGGESYVQFYINGAPQGVESYTETIGAITNSVNLVIGNTSLRPTLHSGIALDEVEIFNVAVPASSIEAIYRAGTVGKCKAGLGDDRRVGGVQGLPEPDSAALQAGGSSGRGVGTLAGLAAAVTAGVVTLGVAAWYARRRWRAV